MKAIRLTEASMRCYRQFNTFSMYMNSKHLSDSHWWLRLGIVASILVYNFDVFFLLFLSFVDQMFLRSVSFVNVNRIDNENQPSIARSLFIWWIVPNASVFKLMTHFSCVCVRKGLLSTSTDSMLDAYVTFSANGKIYNFRGKMFIVDGKCNSFHWLNCLFGA